MKIRSLLAAKDGGVETIRPDQDLVTASQLLRNKGVGALIVTRDGGQLHGLLSERDVVMALAERGALVSSARVADVMRRDVRTCHPDDDLVEVSARITSSRQRHMPVVESGRVVGVVSVGDIVRHRLEEAELETRVLRDVAIARS